MAHWRNTFIEWDGEYYTSCYNETIKAKYRCDPIPGTGRTPGYCGFRHMHQSQEARRYVADEDLFKELGINQPMRRKRSTTMLPDPWDDQFRSDFRHRSWKRHRKTQYRERKVA